MLYNWGMKAIYGGEGGWFNVRCNLFRPGPGTKHLDGEYVELSTGESPSGIPASFYIEGNVYDISAVQDGNYLGKKPDTGKIARNAEVYSGISAEAPLVCRVPIEPEPVRKAYRKVLREAGASHRRDSVDSRIVREVKSGTVTFSGSVTGIPGIIDSEKDIMAESGR